MMSMTDACKMMSPHASASIRSQAAVSAPSGDFNTVTVIPATEENQALISGCLEWCDEDKLRFLQLAGCLE